jgi:PAP2 superfamily
MELAWLICLVWIYNWLQDLAPLRRKLAFGNAEGLLSFERKYGLDPETFLDHWLTHQHILASAASNFYAIASFAVTVGLAAWTWWRRPEVYVPLRSCLVLANLIAFAVFWAFPVAPPRMLPGFVDVVAKAGGLGWHNSLISHADQLAAMPSMHVGYAVWCGLVVWRLAKTPTHKVLAALIGGGYVLVTSLVVMATGNHYLADVLAGMATTLVALGLFEVGQGWLRRRPRTLALGPAYRATRFVPGTVILEPPGQSAPKPATDAPLSPG